MTTAHETELSLIKWVTIKIRGVQSYYVETEHSINVKVVLGGGLGLSWETAKHHVRKLFTAMYKQKAANTLIYIEGTGQQYQIVNYKLYEFYWGEDEVLKHDWNSRQRSYVESETETFPKEKPAKLINALIKDIEVQIERLICINVANQEGDVLVEQA